MNAEFRGTDVNAVDERVDGYDWAAIGAEMNAHGCAVLPKLLHADECKETAALYADEEKFRSRVVMARHGFGKGEYKYLKYPLPARIGELRTALYARIAPIANAWNGRMNIEAHYPAKHADYLELCHKAGQTRPTPLLLQYGAGDFNCLHQDLYGELAFPLQATVLLSDPARDFTGGEFVLTEQRPRMQSRVEVVPLQQGDAVVFAVHNRPAQGARGFYRVNLRHGVSRLRSGHRHTLGIIFHDAK
ncbi:MAG: 2OG-Fe(II) oxygenase [Xanthobacteraceae bacterium]